MLPTQRKFLRGRLQRDRYGYLVISLSQTHSSCKFYLKSFTHWKVLTKSCLKAVNALKSSVSLVENTLAALKKAAPTKIEVKEALKPVTRAPVRFSKAVKNHIDFVPTDPMASVGEPVLKGMASDETPVKNVQEAMSADGLKPTVKSLQQMAEAIEPIIKNFDSVLVRI